MSDPRFPRSVRPSSRRGPATFPIGDFVRVATLAVAFLAQASAGVGFADFFVDPRGDDAAQGTREAPFATLERARAAVRERRANAPLPEGGLTVWLAGGDHVRTAPFELGREDSGTPAAPIVWRGLPGKEVRVLGGRLLRFRRPADPQTLGRIPESARSRVLEADVASWDLPADGGMVSRGFGRATTPAHPELFHDGRPMVLARWPNEGTFETIAGFPETSGRGDDHGGKIGELSEGFLYAGDRPGRWQNPTNAWVHGYWAWDWANSYERIASLDPARRWVRTAPPHGLYGFRKGQRFYFLNILEELDQPGEWFFDAQARKVWFWPPVSANSVADPAAQPVVEGAAWLSVLAGPLVRMTDAVCVEFRDLAWEATRGNGIEIRGGASNRIAGCVLRNLGNWGVDVSGGTSHQIVDCDILDTGDGGVALSGGDRSTLEPARHRVERCLFERQGRWSKCYVPAVILQGVGMTVVNCLVREHPHCGILYGGNDHRIERNEIHHVALETGDVGAIYAGRDYTFRGNVIRHNFIHHTGGVGMGSMGAYMDDCVSGTEISGNIFYKVQRAAFLGGGRDHRVVNNVFVDCNHAVELDGRGLDRSPVWRNMVDQTMRKSLGAAPLALYRERYPEMKSLDAHYGPPDGNPIVGEDFRGVPPENNLVAKNVCVGKWLRTGWNARPEMIRLESNLTDDDPRFVGKPGDRARVEDFALRDDSPAWTLGFERIPVETIGLRRSAHSRSRAGEGVR